MRSGTWPPVGKPPGWKARVATIVLAIGFVSPFGWFFWRVHYGPSSCPQRTTAAPVVKVGRALPVTVTGDGDRLVAAFDRHWWVAYDTGLAGPLDGVMTRTAKTHATFRSTKLAEPLSFQPEIFGCM
jgi:hypothetical protein